MRPVTLTTSDASEGPVATLPCPLDLYISPFQVTLGAVVSGTVDYDAQYTTDDVFAEGYDPSTGNWTPITDMDGATGNAEATLVSPVTAVRLVQNSGGGSVTMRVVQSGLT